MGCCQAKFIQVKHLSLWMKGHRIEQVEIFYQRYKRSGCCFDSELALQNMVANEKHGC